MKEKYAENRSTGRSELQPGRGGDILAEGVGIPLLFPLAFHVSSISEKEFRSGFVAWPGLLALALACLICTIVGWPAICQIWRTIGIGRYAVAMLFANVGVGLLAFRPASFVSDMVWWRPHDYLVIMTGNLMISFAVTAGMLWLLARQDFRGRSLRLRQALAVVAILLFNYLVAFVVYATCLPKVFA